jgi:hypothetical protein
MTTVRTLLPTDLPALLAHSGLGYENAAHPRERLGAGEIQATLSFVRDQLRAFARQRSAWVSMKRQRLQGMVGARQRGGSAAWEIDYLLDATPDNRVTADLLSYAVAQAGKERAQKVFLRLPSESDLLQPVLESGFAVYQEETLYVQEAAPASRSEPVSGLRTSVASDGYPLFRLYCAATPETTRRFEAATFDEWHAAQERRWQKHGLQLVQESDGGIGILVRACRLPQGLMLDLLIDSKAKADVPGLVSAAVAAIGVEEGPILVLLPRAAVSVGQALEGAGFSATNEYVSLIKRTTKPLALPRKVAVVAKNAVGV